jgi:probable DNA metabolism protein
MVTVLYDGSFTGLLTALFEVYEYKLIQPLICMAGSNQAANLFGQTHPVTSDPQKAGRVMRKLQQASSATSFQEFYKTFLSGLPQMEKHLLGYVQYILQAAAGAVNNYANEHVLFVKQTAQKVNREKHRMEAFVRFQLTRDELYYAVVQPDFNVLPLIVRHFKSRYADQRWLIYDLQRQYGIYYNLEEVTEVTLSFTEENRPGNIAAENLDADETIYQQLWQQYFKSVNIAARKNTRLHIQHMPKRYWKHLVEKQPAIR